jgi:hypothetical protein
MSTNYDIWLNVGATEFTRATQDRDPGAPWSQRRMVGPADYDTPLYSSSQYGDTSQSFQYPKPDISMQPLTRWVYKWEDPQFYTMLFQQWGITAGWTGQTWLDYKAELLRVQGLNWCPPPNTRWRHKWGSSHFYNTIDLLLMYNYCYGIVCMITTIIMVLYTQLLLWHCLYAKTMILFLWWGPLH